MDQESPHPQLTPDPGAWYVVVPDGPCFDGGPDMLVGPYDDEAEAWAGHNRLSPWPCRAYRDPSPADEEGAGPCDCVVLPAMSPGPADEDPS